MTRDYPRPIYKYIAFCCSGLTGGLAVMALAGWLTHDLFLAALSSENIPMAPAAAICFLLIASAISLEASHNADAARYVVAVLSLLVALFCGIILLQFAAHLAFDVESVFVDKKEFRTGIPLGRMSPFTSSGILSLVFATFCLAPFFNTSQKRKDLSGILGSIACLLGLVLFLGYIYMSPIFYRVGVIPVSITSALAFILTGTGIVATAGPESFPLRLFTGESSHARLLRLFTPVLFLGLVFKGAADILVIETAENKELAIAFSTITFSLVICGVLIIISRNVSRLLDRSMEAQRQSEARALEQNAELKAVIDAMPAGVLIAHDPKCSEITCNPPWMEIVGADEGQNPFKDAFSGRRRLEIRRNGVPISIGQLPIQVACATGQPVTGDRIEIIRDGVTRHFYGHAVPLFDNHGAVRGAVGVLLDITELKEAQDKIAGLAAIVESSIDAIIGKTLEGIIVSWNPGAEAMYGYSDREAIGRSVSLLVPPDYPDEIPAILEKIRRGETIVSYDTSHMRKDGTQVDVSLTVSPVKDSTGKIIGASTIAHDITNRKKYEERIEQYSRKLEESNKELDNFASIAAHDLRAPLRAVSGFAGLLQKRYREGLDAEADRYISHIVEGTGRMDRLINDLLQYARVTTRERPLAPVNVNTILEKTLANLAVEIKESGAAITVGPLPTVSSDSTQLIQLFQNLIGNAIKYSGSNTPSIHISAELKDGKWFFRVSDNGIGIDPQHFDRIFQIFQRLHASDEYSGTGIGLATCKKIVERFGGRIWVESKPGEGSTFFFTLPVTES